MRMGRVLHQQIMQLRYHILACVGLIMVLPVEEAIVSYSEGRGYYFAHLSLFAICIAPLLTALIACATVQADLDEKRCLFWQSKPVRAHIFMTVKFGTGLVLAMFVLACPLVFLYALSHLSTAIMPFSEFTLYSVGVALVSVLTYSICFFCNVLIRKTARAWLIGLAIAGFVLLVPILLPLPIQDVVTWMSGVYLTLTLGASVLAFCLALAAIRHHWHLQTNLKGLLWAGGGLIFMVAVLLGRQVANIKILDEVQVTYVSDGTFVKEPGRYELGNREVTIADERITVTALDLPAREKERGILLERLRAMPPHYEVEEGLELNRYPHPHFGRITSRLRGQAYEFVFYIYSQSEKVVNKNGREVKNTRYKKVLLRSFQRAGGVQLPVSTLDLSDSIVDEGHPGLAMRRIEDKLVVLLENQCLVVAINDRGELALTEKNRYMPVARFVLDKPFTIPLIPATTIDVRERVRLSIDLAVPRIRNRVYKASLVSDHGGKMRFVLVNDDSLVRYDVIGWDEEKISCQYRDTRASLIGGFSWGESYFVRDNRLYMFSRNKLMVFDVLTDRRIRKLGHFQRFSDQFGFGDIAVEENGNVVLFSNPHGHIAEGRLLRAMSTIYLLKAP